jgi:hypothetical protein
VEKSSVDGLPHILGTTRNPLDGNDLYRFRSKSLLNRSRGLRHSEYHISTRMLPRLSEREATHHVSSTGRDGGICTHQKDAPFHQRTRKTG